MSKLVVLCMGMVVLMLGACCCISNGQSKILTFKDSGQIIKTSTLKKIQIELDANATTGYTWEIVNYDKRILKLNNSTYTPNSKLIGAPGKQFYCFDVIGKGKTELKIIYHRPWEKNIKPAKTFSLTIIAK